MEDTISGEEDAYLMNELGAPERRVCRVIGADQTLISNRPSSLELGCSRRVARLLRRAAVLACKSIAEQRRAGPDHGKIERNTTSDGLQMCKNISEDV